jgi:hypothetical protein
MAGQLGIRAFASLAVLILTGGSAVADLRPAINRPEVLEIGEPALISRAALKREMDRNSDLKEYVDLYGWPDYAEIQRTAVQDPLDDYEVRLYYLNRERELVFVHVHVAPGMTDYGIKRYEGPIPDATLARILTARMSEPEPLLRPEPWGETVPPAEDLDDGAEPAGQQAAAEPEAIEEPAGEAQPAAEPAGEPVQ